MIRRLFGTLGWLFAERQVHYRVHGRIRYFRLSTPLQLFFASIVLGLFGWFSYATIYYLSFDHILRDKDVEIARAQKERQDIMNEVATFKRRVQSITRNMERSRVELLALTRKEGRLIASSKTGINGTQRWTAAERVRVRRSHAALSKRIILLSKTWNELNVGGVQLEKGLATIGTRMTKIVTKNGQLVRERDRLQKVVAGLRTRISDFRSTQEKLVLRLDRRTGDSIEEVEKVILMTGLAPDKLLAKVELDGTGGPLTRVAFKGDANDKLGLQVARLGGKVRRWQKLQKIVRDLPLIAPTDHYRLTNGHGRRRDPFTKGWSMHNGIDLAYHMNSPILSTAHGTVVYAGWRGGYGWTIEIDHGMGIRTRYAHLRKILVTKGQKVEFREKIGLLGSSGRSTGPHVHYEVIVDGKPRDPMKFITAGKYVFKG